VQDGNNGVSGQLDKSRGLRLQLVNLLARVTLQDFQTTLESRAGTKVNCQPTVEQEHTRRQTGAEKNLRPDHTILFRISDDFPDEFCDRFIGSDFTSGLRILSLQVLVKVTPRPLLQLDNLHDPV
jgi:hypothetical protein